MIIDAHYHYMRMPADEIVGRKMATLLMEDVERTGYCKPLDVVWPAYCDIMNDPAGDKLIKRMDENGTDVTAVCIVDNYDNKGKTESLMRYHNSLAKLVSMHPDRLIALCGIDPRRPEAPSLLRTCLTDLKMKGLKWHPDNGYYPNSKEAYAMLEVLNEFGMPLLTHCSPLPHSRAKYAQPIHLDDVAVDFPELNIIAAHMGHLWWHDWAAIAQYKKNLHGDLAMWQITAKSKPRLFRRYLRELVDIVGPHQIVFGSDGPIFEPHVSNIEFFGILRGLQDRGEDGIQFTKGEIDAILGGNAARIFKLQNPGK
jgi:hypothetical protein